MIIITVHVFIPTQFSPLVLLLAIFSLHHTPFNRITFHCANGFQKVRKHHDLVLSLANQWQVFFFFFINIQVCGTNRQCCWSIVMASLSFSILKRLFPRTPIRPSTKMLIVFFFLWEGKPLIETQMGPYHKLQDCLLTVIRIHLKFRTLRFGFIANRYTSCLSSVAELLMFSFFKNNFENYASIQHCEYPSCLVKTEGILFLCFDLHLLGNFKW